MVAGAKTISLVRTTNNSSNNPDYAAFCQTLARNLQLRLSERNIVPRGEGAKVEKLAAMLGANHQEVLDWLMGRYAPNAWQLSNLAKLLNVPVDTLLHPERQESDTSLIDEDYHCVTLHDESNLSDGYSIYMLPETLRHMSLPRSTTIMTIGSDDMAPLYRPHDHVIYDPRVNTVSTNGVYVLKMHGQVVIRRTQRINKGLVRLICDNPALDSEEYSSTDFTKNPESAERIYVIGRALGFIRVNPL